VVPVLPNLKAIVFEVFPSFVPVVGLETIRAQIEKLHELWALRRPADTDRLSSNRVQPRALATTTRPASPAAWENALGGLAIGRPEDDRVAHELAADPGVGVVYRLIQEFRASMIVSVFRLTARLIMLALGPDVFRVILEDFWSKSPPQPFASAEAEAFADHLETLDLKVPQLAKVLEFERAVLATLIDGEARGGEAPPSRPVLRFQDRAAIARACELESGGQPADSGAQDDHSLSCAGLGGETRRAGPCLGRVDQPQRDHRLVHRGRAPGLADRL
jgi:hypothetical protein